MEGGTRTAAPRVPASGRVRAPIVVAEGRGPPRPMFHPGLINLSHLRRRPACGTPSWAAASGLPDTRARHGAAVRQGFCRRRPLVSAPGPAQALGSAKCVPTPGLGQRVKQTVGSPSARQSVAVNIRIVAASIKYHYGCIWLERPYDCTSKYRASRGESTSQVQYAFRCAHTAKL